MSDRAFLGPADTYLENRQIVFAEDYQKLEHELAEALRESEERNQQWALKSIYASELEQTVSIINSQLTAHKAALEKSLFECDQIESGFRSKLHKLESDLFAQTAATHRAKTALLAITSGHFYQSSCRGGEMERLINQAIESLSAVNPSQASQ